MRTTRLVKKLQIKKTVLVTELKKEIRTLKTKNQELDFSLKHSENTIDKLRSQLRALEIKQKELERDLKYSLANSLAQLMNSISVAIQELPR